MKVKKNKGEKPKEKRESRQIRGRKINNQK